MRILVATPVQRGIWYKRSFDSIFALEWGENQLEYHQFVGGDTGAHPYDNITRKSNEARRLVLDNGYDAMLMCETDVILPPDALQRLVRVDAGVVYGLIVHHNGWPVWNAAIEFNDQMAVPISMFADKAKEAWGKVVEVAGVGSSCVLIHRDVLQTIRFRRKDTPEFQRSADWYFAEDCQRLGIVQKCDTQVICGHIDEELVPRILWPDIEARGFYRSEVIGTMREGVALNELEYAKPKAMGIPFYSSQMWGPVAKQL